MISDQDINWHHSVVNEVTFRGRRFYVKRDDLLRPFPGNKARKIEGLLQRDWSRIDRLVSHGGAQSNAMLALARLAAQKNVGFDYHTRKLPDWLRQHPTGNLQSALALGMRLIESASGEPPRPHARRVLFVPRGMAMPEAETGIARLAREIRRFADDLGLTQLTVFLPSGTGATALYLQRHLDFTVATTPCVGDADYLRRQFSLLQPDPASHPLVIEPPFRHVFGKLDETSLAIWRALKDETGITFDLLYDPVGWRTLLCARLASPVLYVHCGGVEGVASMLRRYRRKFA